MRNFSLKQKALLTFGIAALSTALLAGCNVFSIVDKPSGDEQILSKARACFDQADYDCAREYYAQLSSSYADVRASEEAFMILAENGATMADFMETFGSGGSGQALTELAERMAPGSEVKRLKIHEAFKKYGSISAADNPSLRALVRFVGSVALAAEFLSEEISSSGGQLLKTRISSLGGACPSTIQACANCTAPTDPILKNGISNPDFLSSSLNGQIDLGHFKKAMVEMSAALNELSAAGGFSDGAGGLSQDILSQDLDNNLGTQECFRSNMLSLGIGR